MGDAITGPARLLVNDRIRVHPIESPSVFARESAGVPPHWGNVAGKTSRDSEPTTDVAQHDLLPHPDDTVLRKGCQA
jgi:hypothetical protein